MASGVLVLSLGGLGFGLLGALTTGDAALAGRLFGGALAYAPALWATAGVAVALYGWLPRWTVLAWAVPGYGFVTGHLGPVLGLPGGFERLSPFGPVPRLPAEPVDWTAPVVLTAVAAGLTALGLAGFRRRDLRST